MRYLEDSHEVPRNNESYFGNESQKAQSTMDLRSDLSNNPYEQSP